MTPSIRRFGLCDSPGLVSTINAVCAEGRWMRTLRYEPTPAWEHALNDADCPEHLLLVVEDAARIVGWCRTFPTSCQNGSSMQASLGIGLVPAFRDRGIGTALVRTSLDWARGAGLARITLTARPDNQRALHVFRKCGFTLVGEGHNGTVAMTVELGE